jgi:hypothetical protein
MKLRRGGYLGGSTVIASKAHNEYLNKRAKSRRKESRQKGYHGGADNAYVGCNLIKKTDKEGY